VGGRIYAGQLHPDETANMPRPAIVIKTSGGVSLTGESNLEHDTERFDVFAFGATPYEAATVLRRAAHDLRALKRGVYGGVGIHWVNRAGGSIPGREPVVEWPRRTQAFQALYALNQVQS
jgi:hypothetical protein